MSTSLRETVILCKWEVCWTPKDMGLEPHRVSANQIFYAPLYRTPNKDWVESRANREEEL